MKTINRPDVRAALRSRLERLTASAERKWGKMTVHQMLAHVARSMERVARGERFADMPTPPSRLIKIVALRLPVRWPRGLPSGSDPASAEVDPSSFEVERARAIAALEALAAADGAALSPAHSAFGPMSAREWYRWAYCHLDHHLRQFGV